MKRSEYPGPHDVTLICKQIDGGTKTSRFNQVQTVLVDGQPLCLPRDTVVTIESVAGGAGSQVTLTLLARSVSSERYEYEPKHLQEAENQ